MATRYMYQAEVSHKGLNKYRVIKAATQYELNQKSNALMAQWNEQWEKKVERETKIKNDEDSLAYANEMTQQAEDVQNALDRILLNSLNPQSLDLNTLKDFSKFPETRPKRPSLSTVPEEPQLSDSKYNPKPSFFTKISKKKMAEFTEKNTTEFAKDSDVWKMAKASIEGSNKEQLQKYDTLVEQWEIRKADYERSQAEENQKVDLFFEKYKVGNVESVERYFAIVLEKIDLPFNCNRSIDVEYVPLGKTLIVDMLLPIVDDIPNQKSVSYIKSKKEFKESYHSESYIKKKYDEVIYQIVLQTLNYIFTLSFEYALVDSVVINGKINTIDKSTGKSIEPYVLSVSVARSVFEEVNLSAVDPKAWFKSAKGVSAASLAIVEAVYKRDTR